MDQPLAGIRVIAVEQYGAGPYGTMFLADLGAEVIKVENPNTAGEISRTVGPYFLGENDSYFFQTFNRNKKSICLDLKSAKDRVIFEKLVATSDAVTNNLRGDQPAKLRITYDDLKEIKPALVCAHLSAYGRDNERAGWPGYDYLMQAEAGFLSLTGEPDGPPARFGLSMVDYMTGMTLSFALVSALLGARQTGKGGDVDVALFDMALHQLTYPAAWYLNEGVTTGRQPRSAHPSLSPSQLFKTQDSWIFLMCQTDKFWQIFCRRMDRADLLDRAEFKDMAARLQNRTQLQQELDAIFEERSTQAWLELLRGHLPVAPVNNIAQALDDPFVESVGMLSRIEHAEKPAGLRMLANPIKIDGVRAPDFRGPRLGEHTKDLLEELGLTAEGE